MNKRFTALLVAISVVLGIFAPIRVDIVRAARLWSSGAEQNSVVVLEEFHGIQGSPTISSATKRTGNYSVRVLNTTGTVEHRFSQDEISVPGCMRGYLYIATAVNAAGNALYFGNNSGAQSAAVELQTDNTLKLFMRSTQVGSASSALSANTWYRIDLYARVNGTNMEVTGRLDGVTFASTTTGNQVNAFNHARWGLGGAATVGEIFMDDMALNNTAGVYQNECPGAGGIVHFRPAAAGDTDTVSKVPSGLPGWRVVSEETPNEATDYANFKITDDSLEVTSSTSAWYGIGVTDNITLVQVGTRQSSANAQLNNLRLTLKSQTGGTKATQEVQRTSTGWDTHDDTIPRNYKLTSYTDPQTGAAWNYLSLNTMQFGGVVIDAAPDYYISTFWALVEFTPNVDVPTSGVAKVKVKGGLLRIVGGLLRIR